MKVTLATTWDSRCGVAGYSRSLLAELEKHVTVEVVSLDPSASGRSPARLAAAMNEGDVAHIQHQYPFFGGMALHRNWLKRVLGRIEIPLVVTVHELDMGEFDSWPIRTYKRWFNRYLFGALEIDRIVVHTFEYLEKMADLGIEPADVRVIPMGVPEVSPPPISPRLAKSKLGLAGKRVVTIFGFVVRRKDYELALEALRHWPEDVVLLIAGGPHPDDRTGFFEKLQDRIEAGDQRSRVVVTGYLPGERIPTVMAATDVILAPFTAMSSSWSIMQAMAYWKPIVASDLTPTREMNSRLPCVSLFKAADLFDLVEKVRKLLEDRQKRADAVAAIRAYAETYSVARSAAVTAGVYEELLED